MMRDSCRILTPEVLQQPVLNCLLEKSVLVLKILSLFYNLCPMEGCD